MSSSAPILLLPPALVEDFEDEFDFGQFSTFGSDIIDVSLRTDFEKTFDKNHYFRYGAGLTQHFFRPEKSYDEFTAPETGDLDTLDSDFFGGGFSTDFQAQEFEAYFEDEFKLGDKWHFQSWAPAICIYSG